MHVWSLSLPNWSPHLPAFEAVLSAEEHTRANRFRTLADRTRFIVGRGALRLLTAAHLNRAPTTLAVHHGPHGKPYVGDTAVPFGINLSHSGDWIVIAAGSLSELGVDVEKHQPDVDPLVLAESVFSPWERKQLRAMPSSLHTSLFFDLWSRKEAVIKADGAGVSFGLDRFDIEFRPHLAPAVRWIDGDDPDRWTLRDLTVAPGYSAAVAGRASFLRVHSHSLVPPS